MSTAGIFDNEQMRPYDFAAPYVQHFLRFIGIIDTAVFRVEGTAIAGMQQTAFSNAVDKVASYYF